MHVGTKVVLMCKTIDGISRPDACWVMRFVRLYIFIVAVLMRKIVEMARQGHQAEKTKRTEQTNCVAST